jgi:hypothetical protein
VSVGKFDGEHPSLTCATSAGKIFFHTPHEKDAKDQIRFLNMNRKISSLACGTLDTSVGRDVLLVGAQTSLLAYDVHDNRDLFFKETPDCANQIVVGRLGGQAVPMALVGGNCSIQGFDKDGNEAFWTVTGDNVSSMAVCDVDEDGELELMVGSDDYEVRHAWPRRRARTCMRTPATWLRRQTRTRTPAFRCMHAAREGWVTEPVPPARFVLVSFTANAPRRIGPGDSGAAKPPGHRHVGSRTRTAAGGIRSSLSPLSDGENSQGKHRGWLRTPAAFGAHPECFTMPALPQLQPSTPVTFLPLHVRRSAAFAVRRSSQGAEPHPHPSRPPFPSHPSCPPFPSHPSCPPFPSHPSCPPFPSDPSLLPPPPQIRCFRGEEVISESTETDRPIHLTRLHHTSFAYALANGTIGVYETPSQRRWRVKSKHQATAITGFDLDGDGHPELVSGWANGKLEVRSDRSGEVIFKDNLGAPISAIVQADYRADGRTEVRAAAGLSVCAGQGGESGCVRMCVRIGLYACERQAGWGDGDAGAIMW